MCPVVSRCILRKSPWSRRVIFVTFDKELCVSYVRHLYCIINPSKHNGYYMSVTPPLPTNCIVYFFFILGVNSDYNRIQIIQANECEKMQEYLKTWIIQNMCI
jgi:hypothetical protein